MICIFFVQTGRGEPVRVGPVQVRDLQEARRVAAARMFQDEAAVAVDVWIQSGELFRVTRADEARHDDPIPLRPELTRAGPWPLRLL